MTDGQDSRFAVVMITVRPPIKLLPRFTAGTSNEIAGMVGSLNLEPPYRVEFDKPLRPEFGSMYFEPDDGMPCFDPALSLPASIRSELGSLDRVRRFVRVHAVVNLTPDFTQHTQVINGAADLFVEVFGEAGRHARLAVGVAQPGGAPMSFRKPLLQPSPIPGEMAWRRRHDVR